VLQLVAVAELDLSAICRWKNWGEQILLLSVLISAKSNQSEDDKLAAFFQKIHSGKLTLPVKLCDYSKRYIDIRLIYAK
jgi:hypothetical protein